MISSTCSVGECDRKAKSRGWCASHLEKWRRYGDPLHVPPRTARLFNRVAGGAKVCRGCGRELAFTEFYSDPHRADGHKDSCKGCSNSEVRQWEALNPERVATYRRKRHQEKSEAQRIKDLGYVSEWKRQNPEKVRDYIHRRRAAKASVGAGEIDLDELWVQCEGFCPDCGLSISREAPWGTPEFASIDHILPLAVGGAHTQENVRYTCLPCNLRKGAKVLSS